ncbi:MAG: hypothetical protein ABIK82_12170 [Pseudomonadota bacterium]
MRKKKPARRLAFSCPKAGEDLLLCVSSSSRGSGGGCGRGGGGGGSRGGSSSGCRFSGLRGFGFATGGYSQGEEGSDEERVLHFSEILNVMEVLGQLIDCSVADSVNE